MSRGELVEIGGSFRVPDIMAKSGARLVEVGTTNRTHLEDYRRALGAHGGAIVKVHRSNFAIEGYVAEATVRELVPLAQARGAAVVHDLGSGLLHGPRARGDCSGEPVAADAVRDGADVVTMSGDKLLGGPQAGIILGRARRDRDAADESAHARAARGQAHARRARGDARALPRAGARAPRDPGARDAHRDAGAARASARRELAASLGGGARAVASEGSVGGGAFPTARLAGRRGGAPGRRRRARGAAARGADAGGRAHRRRPAAARPARPCPSSTSRRCSTPRGASRS